jgi:hypothetical protein
MTSGWLLPTPSIMGRHSPTGRKAVTWTCLVTARRTATTARHANRTSTSTREPSGVYTTSALEMMMLIRGMGLGRGADVLDEEVHRGDGYTVTCPLYNYSDSNRVRKELDKSFEEHISLAMGLLHGHVNGIPRSYKGRARSLLKIIISRPP